MDWAEALDIVVDRTKHERYRALCGPDHPNHPAWRSKIVELATGIKQPVAYPSLTKQAANALGALGRVAGAVLRGEPVKVAPAVYYERLAICRPCEFNGERPFGVRCTKCGCGGLKLELATEACPIGKWPATNAQAAHSEAAAAQADGSAA